MISSIQPALRKEPGYIAHQGAVDAFCKTTPFNRAGWLMVSTETFLQPLSEITLDVDPNHPGTYDGMRGDGEALPRFTLRFRRNFAACDSRHNTLPLSHGVETQLTQPAVAFELTERTKESACQNA
ncbi:protein of unknown function [Pseudodesulfovibrio profundus]|uniref:Uncharacterized protein n=1 Tax=Pseudodesulfovibrio profundus TaxID=57320 RepID=A0A2C8FCI7_9BACT|nr:protein of unknown function [Pseudodesulfovibrio profundus]